ncbi:MAG: DUF4236 domain-containing protein [Candidatus Omnitrophota bacterium]|nr:DUF4236 domain-containing protein [Candidatus Omnitrophota bacterium]
MAWKFRKRLTLFPGFRINLSKSGLSATVGIRGLSVNVGQNGAFLNTGIPGTGIYDRKRIGAIPGDVKDQPIITPEENRFTQYLSSGVTEIKSFVPELLTSDGFFGLKESIIKAQEEKNNLRNEYHSAKAKHSFSIFLLVISYLLLFGFFIKWFKNNSRTKKQDAVDVRKVYEDFKLEIDFNLDNQALNEYISLENHYDLLSKSIKIWDVTSSKENDMIKTRSAASSSVTRTPVNFERGQVDYISTKYISLKLNNANGGSLYIYPGFLIMPSKISTAFAIIDFRDLRFEHHTQRFIEEEGVPSDSHVVDQTWRYVNKNGNPDRRFSNNYQIPVVHYYEINFKTEKGLNESYQISNLETGRGFANALEKYCESLKKLNWSSVVQPE